MSAPKHKASKALVKALERWQATRDDYARYYAETRGGGGIGTRNEAMRAEVAHYDASEALLRLLWEGVEVGA